MRCCAPSPNPEEDAKSSKIDEALKEEKKRLERSNEFKLLLLGPGESGKSTIFKQLKLIQTVSNKGFNDQERQTFKYAVHSNCIEQMRLLIKGVQRLEKPFCSETNLRAAEKLITLPHCNNVWTPALGQAIQALWGDPVIQEAYKRSTELELQLNDTANYFFDEIARLIPDSYEPTDADILRTRIRSVGIEEARFVFDNMTFRVVDVGGQRSERRKWIHCFDCVTAVIFCAGLSDYDLTLKELKTVKRMEEALNLFEDVSSSTFFVQTDIILFLNKRDLFHEKLRRGIDLRVCFPQYQGGSDPAEAEEFVQKRFLERVTNGRMVFVHFTVAVDTQQIEHVIKDVRRIATLNQMKKIGPGI